MDKIAWNHSQLDLMCGASPYDILGRGLAWLPGNGLTTSLDNFHPLSNLPFFGEACGKGGGLATSEGLG